MARKRSAGSRPSGRAYKTLEEEQMWHRILEALYHMRVNEMSLTSAARESGTTPRTMKKHLGWTLEKSESGYYEAKPTDRLLRRLRFLTPEGQITLDTRSYHIAEKIGRYWNAVDAFLRTGRSAALGEFRGKAVRVGSRLHLYVTEPRVLRRLALAGEVRFEDLYDLTAG